MESSNTSRHPKQFDTSSVARLSNDILLMIFDLLPKKLLRNVSQVCQSFHDMAIPILFREVDLRVYPIIDIHNPQFPVQWPPFAQSILLLQWRFAKQISLSPSYASFIRTFNWTMGLEHYFECWDEGIKEDFDLTLIYSMFTHLTNATHINIYTGSRLLEAIPRVPTLFPAARHLHLGGKMYYTLASAILHGDSKASLISLTLDNFIESDVIHDPDTKPTLSETTAGGQNVNLAFEEILSARPPKQLFPGTRRRLLTSESFQNRCRELQYLCLRKQGQQARSQYFPMGKLHDLGVYDEWALFISIVKPKVLVIAHLGSLERWHYWKDSPYLLQPKDEAFRDILLPVLMKPWEGLERLEVRGVNRCAIPTSLEGLKGVAVTIDEEVLPCWNSMAELRRLQPTE